LYAGLVNEGVEVECVAAWFACGGGMENCGGMGTAAGIGRGGSFMKGLAGA